MFSHPLSILASITAVDCCVGGVKTKRVKAACILQTLVFAQKEDCGPSRNSILDANRREFEHYKQTLNRTHTRYQIVSCNEQKDGTLIVRVRKQYNDTADVTEYFQ